jgi:hypothetical protein
MEKTVPGTQPGILFNTRNRRFYLQYWHIAGVSGAEILLFLYNLFLSAVIAFTISLNLPG